MFLLTQMMFLDVQLIQSNSIDPLCQGKNSTALQACSIE